MEPLPQRLRDSPLVSCVKFGGDNHLITLYADNVILTVAEPMTSLPALLGILDEFSQVLGFKVNMQKSQILSLSVTPDHEEDLRARYPFLWSSSRLSSLGVELATSAAKTASVNYTKLVREVQRDLESWGRHRLSWLGRVAAVKMTILPRILYVFQALPLTPPPRTIATLQSAVLRFIWEGRPARLPRQVLYCPKGGGGLAIPCLLCYFQATQLRFLLEWSLPLTEKHWCYMDQAVAGTHIWKEPWLRRRHRARGLYSSPVTGATLRIWDTVACRLGLTSFLSPMTPIGENPDFEPGLNLEGLKRWYDGGCRRVGSLFDEQGVLSVDQMKEMYGLREADRLMYYQVRHWALLRANRALIDRPLTPFEKWLLLKMGDKGSSPSYIDSCRGKSDCPSQRGS
ncbi:hypothetical protein NDU88_011126 [Pleurodeles waltl]|uniref:Reverse transcriptase domain-containing protein n=1 Tax=Pleurodeles waltl TaxID=8319 RepID=A0AAV7QZ68_PLEWA|nr:hypothetical protein NDU88_011126 [Pleurodeles waltl]